MSDHKYRIAYCVEPIPGDGMTKDEMIASERYCDWGGTDQCIIVSIIEAGGSRSIQIHSRNPDGSQVHDLEVYETIILLARQLALKGDLDDMKTQMCWLFFNAQLEGMGLPPQDLERARRIFADELGGGSTLATRKIQ